MKVKVKVLKPIFESKNYFPGDVFETTLERAKQLGDAVKILSEKSFKPENKMVKEKKVKKK